MADIKSIKKGQLTVENVSRRMMIRMNGPGNVLDTEALDYLYD